MTRVLMKRAAAIFAVVVACSAVTVWYSKPGWLLPMPASERNQPFDSNAVKTPAFEEISRASQVDFVHCAGLISEEFFFPQIMGSGCALFDFDRDGDLDLYVVDGSPTGCDHPGNRLFRNDGQARFVDVSAGSGLDFAAVGMGVAVGDVNNDGYPDVYVTNYGSDRLFLNQRGNGTFVDTTAAAGIDNARWGTSCAFVDYDRDGWLDLFVVNYVDYHAPQRCVEPNGRPDYCNPKLFRGTPAKLYRNETGRRAAGGSADRDDSGSVVRFRDVSLESQIAREAGPGLGVVCADFNGDRWPDIFVANDGAANFLWINRKDGTFREEAVLHGVAYNALGRPQANMGVALGDVDGDGGFDVLMTHLGGEGCALYRRRGSDVFDDDAAKAGLAMPSFPWTGFGAAFLDIDHDGALDLAVVNGRVKRRDGAPYPGFPGPGQAATTPDFWGAYAERNQVYLNDGAGKFREQRCAAEPFTRDAAVSRGLALGDIDDDGALDLVVTSTAGPVRLFRNIATKRGHWLIVRAVEPALGGRDALGASVTLYSGERKWSRLINAGGSYLSASDPRVHFGLGEITAFDRIDVLWPDGSDEAFEGGPVDRIITLEHGRGEQRESR